MAMFVINRSWVDDAEEMPPMPEMPQMGPCEFYRRHRLNRHPFGRHHVMFRRSSPDAECHEDAGCCQNVTETCTRRLGCHGKKRGMKEGKETEGESFQVQLNVASYKPDEIKVKLIDDKTLIIEGEHKEESEGGSSERRFKRVMTMPDNVITQQLKSQLTKDGVLKVSAPKKVEAIEGPKEKEIAIEIEKKGETEENKEIKEADNETKEKEPEVEIVVDKENETNVKE